MSKQDDNFRNMHIPKKVRFSQPKPVQPVNAPVNAPHQPPVGTNARNQFR